MASPRIRRFFPALAVLLSITLGASAAHAQLRGHGGPVKSIAISRDGTEVISGSFDQSAIRWSLKRDAAEQVLRFHEGAVNATAMLPDGRAVTGGEDGRIAIWRPGASEPERVLDGHQGPVVALAASPDGATLASASWDRTARLWLLNEGEPRVLEGHQQNVNGVAFMPDGSALVTAGYDQTVRIWRREGAPVITTLPTPLNAVAVAPDGEIAAGGADGKVWFLSPTGEGRNSIDVVDTPVIGIAISADGALVAAAGIRGAIAIIDRKSRTVARTLVGPGLPVWSLVFAPGRRLITGGTDRMIRRWDAVNGDHIGSVPLAAADDPLAAYAGDRGAEVFRACVACHTLTPDEGNRAGPTLAGIFGRRIATLPGYRFSEPLKRMDIVWTPETVAKLFEIGPSAYTPGTKMPEQKITSSEDRVALVQFLKRVTHSP
jgi:cytochrome c